MATNNQKIKQRMEELKEFTLDELKIILVMVRGIIETGDEWYVIKPALTELEYKIINLMNDIYEQKT